MKERGDHFDGVRVDFVVYVSHDYIVFQTFRNFRNIPKCTKLSRILQPLGHLSITQHRKRGHVVNPWSGHWDPMCRVAQPKT